MLKILLFEVNTIFKMAFIKKNVMKSLIVLHWMGHDRIFLNNFVSITTVIHFNLEWIYGITLNLIFLSRPTHNYWLYKFPSEVLCNVVNPKTISSYLEINFVMRQNRLNSFIMAVILNSSRTSSKRIIIFWNQSRTKQDLVKTAIFIISVFYIAYLLYYVLPYFLECFNMKYRFGLISSRPTFLRMGDFLNLSRVGDLK